MSEFRTWKYRLIPAYYRRKIGSSLLLSASFHMCGMRNTKFDIVSHEVIMPDKNASDLMMAIWHKDGNFYKTNHCFPVWIEIAERKYHSFRGYFAVLGAALRGSKDVGFLD